ncbi:hypothetical protein NERG_01757 [Nematocida ausubeli]|uniref:Uncharacterized protein n=1 Tax=Nematocida ausubeli (strain ATCC PRA-371 / ERTm2) TaxID=1913371 RepID=H8ZDT6_NEMA1|nr:hypothetical protein NERG_01757 [Nematocida ausubeli]
MEFVVENLWYIDNNMAVDLYQDAEAQMYVVPKHAVPYSTIFAELDTFNKFYTYALKKREDLNDKGIIMALTNIYAKSWVGSATTKKILQGYRMSRILAQSTKTSYIMEILKKMSRKHGYMQEGDVDRVFLESNTYLANLMPSQFYKMECCLARYFISVHQLPIAHKFAKEALDLASRGASAQGISDSRSLLIEIEEKIGRKKASS